MFDPNISIRRERTTHCLIVSAGPDGLLGLYEPDDYKNYGYLAQPIPGQEDALTDNIMYLNVRAGGK